MPNAIDPVHIECQIPQELRDAQRGIKFLLPVFVGDCVECYAEIEKVGTSSMTVKVEALVERRESGEKLKVTEGRFVYVAINKDRQPVKVVR